MPGMGIRFQSVVASVILAAAVASAQNNARQPSAETQAHEETQPAASGSQAFSLAVADRLLSSLREAIVGQNSTRTLALFDNRMPEYSEFAVTLKSIFDRYDWFRVRYHILETTDERGMAVVNFTLEATPQSGTEPSVERTERLRFAFGREDDKDWKIIDIQPRELFSSF